MKEKIENIPILVFLLIGVALGGYNYMGSLSVNENLQGQISQLTSQLHDKKESLSKVQNASAEIPMMKDEITKFSQSLSKAQDLIPVGTTARDVLSVVSKQAKDAGVRITTSKPLEAVPKNYFDELPMDVEFEGSYSQLTFFMYLVSKEKLIVHPTDMELGVKEIVDGQTNLKMRGKLVGFRYKEAKQ